MRGLEVYRPSHSLEYTVELEDQTIVALVQKGVAASSYTGGRFAPEQETGPHWFERLLARDLEMAIGGGAYE